uniref:G-protein coupled receptors family 3 profile domain-containing protein n=1 Tax=Globisporangium ultimum (strain ATCC 200006 / CBS 805.95 / DAOM BR144) TaxID=431595 RepID=K3X531_GLOUD
MVCAIASDILILVLVLAMVFGFVYRKAPIIERSQFELLKLMIFGSILMHLSAIAYTGEPSDVLCAVRPLLVSSGFTTKFGAPFLKSLRVYRVFMKGSKKRVTISILMMVKVLSVFYVNFLRSTLLLHQIAYL